MGCYSFRFEHAWESIQWKQWRLRRRFRRQMGSIATSESRWYQQVFCVLEYPFILVRNATIPPVEADSWSQTQAVVRFCVICLSSCFLFACFFHSFLLLVFFFSYGWSGAGITYICFSFFYVFFFSGCNGNYGCLFAFKWTALPS